MKKTTKKLSLGMKIASVLACLAIVSVGFASWWIVKMPNTIPDVQGSFESYAVVDKEIQISTPTYDDPKIVFGKPESGTTRWLAYDDTKVQDENLISTMSFTVSIKDDTSLTLDTFVKELNIEFAPQAPTEENETKNVFDKAIANGSIAAPVIEYKVNDGAWTSAGTYTTEKLAFTIPAPNTNTANVQIRFTFKWGADCGNQNPYIYFNAEGQTYEDDAETARALLSDVAKLTGTTYKVTIDCTAK